MATDSGGGRRRRRRSTPFSPGEAVSTAWASDGSSRFHEWVVFRETIAPDGIRNAIGPSRSIIGGIRATYKRQHPGVRMLNYRT